MKKLLISLFAFFVALVTKADVMLYWTVTEADGVGETSLHSAVASFYNATYTGEAAQYPSKLYASIEVAKASSDVYTALDTIVVGSAIDTNITGYTDSFDKYVIRLYNEQELVAFSDVYTYQSLVSNDSVWVTNTMGMKANMAFAGGAFHAAPEPTSALLMLLGLAGLALKRKQA